MTNSSHLQYIIQSWENCGFVMKKAHELTRVKSTHVLDLISAVCSAAEPSVHGRMTTILTEFETSRHCYVTWKVLRQ